VDHEIVLALGESHPAGEDGPWAATINGRSFPDAPHLQFLQGERVLVHLANLGEAVHTLHVHGHRWLDVGEGRPIDNKFLTPHEENATTAQADFLLVAGEPGDWMYHCHIYDHINAGMTGVMTVLPADGSGGGPHAH
jgi:FtsP/CotA-like multicopper oxidase with cupredoxin domain